MVPYIGKCLEWSITHILKVCGLWLYSLRIRVKIKIYGKTLVGHYSQITRVKHEAEKCLANKVSYKSEHWKSIQFCAFYSFFLWVIDKRFDIDSLHWGIKFEAEKYEANKVNYKSEHRTSIQLQLHASENVN